jgi:chorismate mutase
MSRTSELLSTLLERNGIGHDQLVSIIFTSTKDLRSAFPALAARELGLGDVPLLCAGELDVIGGNPNTIRVLVHCYSTVPRASLRTSTCTPPRTYATTSGVSPMPSTAELAPTLLARR